MGGLKYTHICSSLNWVWQTNSHVHLSLPLCCNASITSYVCVTIKFTHSAHKHIHTHTHIHTYTNIHTHTHSHTHTHFIIQVTHHLDTPGSTDFPQTKKFVTECFRVIKPGGCVVLTVLSKEQCAAKSVWYNTLIPEATRRQASRYCR